MNEGGIAAASSVWWELCIVRSHITGKVFKVIRSIYTPPVSSATIGDLAIPL